MNRAKELNVEFKKIESNNIASIRLTITNSADSILLDSLTSDNDFCQKMRQSLLELRDNSGPGSRQLSSRTVYLAVVTTANEHLSMEVHVTEITALVFIQTKNKDSAEGLGDFYSSTEIKSLLEQI